MEVSSVNVQVIVQLWQIAFSLLAAGLTLVGMGFVAAKTFVTRNECFGRGRNSDKKWDDLYTIARKTQEDVAYLKGKLGHTL